MIDFLLNIVACFIGVTLAMEFFWMLRKEELENDE